MANTEIKKAENIEQIAIFGSAHADLDSEIVKEVFEVAKKLAMAGYIVVDGGDFGNILGNDGCDGLSGNDVRFNGVGRF